jgi:hypothetical protein
MADDLQKQSNVESAEKRNRASIHRRSLFGSGRPEDTDEWLQGMTKMIQ